MTSRSGQYADINPGPDQNHAPLDTHPGHPSTTVTSDPNPTGSPDQDASGGVTVPSTHRASWLTERINRIPDRIRNDFVATAGEFVGTFLFLWFPFASGIIANEVVPEAGEEKDPTALLYTALGFGVSLAVNVWLFFRVTGGMFNPAVTLALFCLGLIPGLRAICVIIAQFLGGIAAAGLASAMFPSPLSVGTRLSLGVSIAQGLFIEVFLTAQLVLAIIMLAVIKHKATFLAPLGIGLAFFLTQLVGIPYTGGSLNPARSLGPDVINRSFPRYHWIYWLGPCLGSLMAVGFYLFLRAFRFETCIPGQDAEFESEAVFKGKGGLAAAKVVAGRKAGTGAGMGVDERMRAEAEAAETV
ncbi:aquaporin rerated protein, other eukaryote [Blastomyces parvus]|uniref:Aquaporin rerated protein, other eukaryote n=1 Tax=Blastomyces parvus TaxID=2060905 RepID=A0A2B7XDL4_9EURO|nr:aquaporin rerated protein, other eukaryote [Blastomyces parvus]